VYLLALAASRPATPYEAVTLGRRRADGPSGREVTVACVRLSADPEARRVEALRELAVLVDLFERGMCEPLPLWCKTSAAYAAAAASGKDGQAAAGKEWTTDWKFTKENAEPEHVLVYAGRRTLDELFAERPRRDERGDGWVADEPTRAGRYARRLWDGLRAREELIDR
jgi:exodeoxyribonuclease V gamma subunit